MKYRRAHDNVKKSGLLNLDGFNTNRSRVFKSEGHCHSKLGSFTSRDFTKRGFRISRKELQSPVMTTLPQY